MCEYWSCHVLLWQQYNSPFLCEKGNNYVKFFNTEEKGAAEFKDVDWFQTPPPTLNPLSCNLFPACFCCCYGRSRSQPHKGSSLRSKSSPHKILFEINSVTFTTQRQTHCQTHPDLRHHVKQVLHILINKSSEGDSEEVQTSSCFRTFDIATFVEENFDQNVSKYLFLRIFMFSQL